MTRMRKDIVLNLVGISEAELWGMPLAEWQRRAWAKQGATPATSSSGNQLFLGIDWVLSPGLQIALLNTPGAALVVQSKDARILVALHVPKDGDAALAQMVGTTNPDEDALKKAGFQVGDIADFADDYNRELRKREAPYAMSLQTHSKREVEQRLFKGSYKGVTDFVTKYAWPIPAFHATRWVADRQITPNMVTTVSLMMVIIAFICFWHGAWLLGIICAWFMTFLDTVDGKLARTTMTYSKWGNIYDHGIDLIHPPFWYWAIWHGLAQQDSGESSGFLYVSLMVILIGYVLNRVEEGIFMHRFGFHIHIWERIDSIMREYTARRNPNMVIFMICVFLGVPGLGLALVAFWTIACLIFHGVRLVQAFKHQGPVVSWLEG